VSEQGVTLLALKPLPEQGPEAAASVQRDIPNVATPTIAEQLEVAVERLRHAQSLASEPDVDLRRILLHALLNAAIAQIRLVSQRIERGA
jgi:hypothetical protein